MSDINNHGVGMKLLKDSVGTPRNTKTQRFIRMQRCFTMFRSLKNTCKIISVLSLVPLTTFFVKPDVALAGDFAISCDEIGGFEEDGRYILAADCEDTDGLINLAEISISDFVANYGGNLSWANPPGNFNQSCQNIDVDEDGILSADCGDGRGNVIGTELNLNERISNQDGVLDYDD